MNQTDLITMLGNLSASLFQVQRLVSGAAYLIGLTFFLVAIQKLRKIGDYRANSSSGESMFVPIAYMLGGAMFVFLPSGLSVMSTTFFGSDNVLSYTSFNQHNIYAIMAVIIKTVGLIWFIRGIVLLTHSSNPGAQHGPKGFLFFIAGIFMINFEYTVSIFNRGLELFFKTTLSAKGWL